MMGRPLFSPSFYAGFRFDYDKNGNMTSSHESQDPTHEYNWDNKLRSATKGGSDTISLKYDPLGNRIFKDSSVSEIGARKYIVDIVGDLPVILMEIDTADSSVKKTYIYANGQILAQHDGDYNATRYFYLHDRLGSVRQIIKSYDTYYVELVSHYTYNPFGELFPTEFSEGVSNPFKFTGQYLDDEIGQYYLRARMYDPHLYRFISRDLIDGKFEEPLTLHKYLYCTNDPVNWIDLNGLWRDGIRYALREEGVSNAYTLSDEEILSNQEWKEEIWDTTWHGHSDFGFLTGDFDYTTLDHLLFTRPENVVVWPIGLGTALHFNTLKDAEVCVMSAIRSGNVEAFEQAMHMGQDFFSHLGRGYGPVEHFLADNRKPDYPDNPYSSGKQLNSYYKDAQRWTKQFEEQWYIRHDPEKWLELPY